MRKWWCLFFCIVSVSVSAQTVDDEFLSGTWTVKKAVVSTKSSSAETKDLLEGFQKGTYQFLPDHSFIFTTSGKGKLITQFSKMLTGNKWLLDPKKKRVGIGFKKDGYSTLGIQIKTEGKKIIFVLEETGIELTVKKQKR